MPLVSPVTLFLLVIIILAALAGSFYDVKPIRISFDMLYLLAWYALLRVLLPDILPFSEALAYLLLFIYDANKICVGFSCLFDSFIFGSIPLFIFTPTMLKSPLVTSKLVCSPANGNIKEPLRLHFWLVVMGVWGFFNLQLLLLLGSVCWCAVLL